MDSTIEHILKEMLEEGKQEVIIMSVLKILQEILLMEQKY